MVLARNSYAFLLFLLGSSANQPIDVVILVIVALLPKPIDAGSFVSPRAIPQMADTNLVIPQLEVSTSNSKILVIVANERGAEAAVQYDEISYLGFPFSISETFQERNIKPEVAQPLTPAKGARASRETRTTVGQASREGMCKARAAQRAAASICCSVGKGMLAIDTQPLLQLRCINA